MSTPLFFVQIAAMASGPSSGPELFALDIQGFVWRYVAARGWERLTHERIEPDETPDGGA